MLLIGRSFSFLEFLQCSLLGEDFRNIDAIESIQCIMNCGEMLMHLILICRKYEEINPAHVEDFCYITDNTYTKDEVVKMEADVLTSLKFEMGNPTTKTFLR